MLVPRIVVVTRATELEAALATHGTMGQVRFFLEERNQDLFELEQRQAAQDGAVHAVLGGLPADWRSTRIDRCDLPRFVFEPDDVVVVVGQDGLVANVSRYLDGQPVVGVNPDPGRYDGVLVRIAPDAAVGIAVAVAARAHTLEERTMIRALTDDGQELLSLNEIFFGHVSHQSARYLIWFGEDRERQSSSGVIVASGTGATGWARSIAEIRHSLLELPAPEDPELVFFAREPFPSVATGTELAEGIVDKGEVVTLRCELTEGGVIFGDGIEADSIPLRWGQEVEIGRADQVLRLA